MLALYRLYYYVVIYRLYYYLYTTSRHSSRDPVVLPPEFAQSVCVCVCVCGQVSPPELAHLHSETLSYLPFTYQVNSNRYTHPSHHYNPKARYTLLHPPHQPHGPPVPDDDAVIFANFNQAHILKKKKGSALYCES